MVAKIKGWDDMPAHKKAQHHMKARSKALASAFDTTWAAALTAPMFKTNFKYSVPAKKVGAETVPARTVHNTRLQRAIGAHAFQIASAGATAAYIREQQLDCKLLGVPYSKSGKGAGMTMIPMLASTKYLIEQVLVAYLKEVRGVSLCGVEITPDAIRMGKREKEKDKSGRVKK